MKKESSWFGKFLKRLNINEVSGVYILGLIILFLNFLAFSIYSNKRANDRLNNITSSSNGIIEFKNNTTDVLVRLDKAHSQQLLFTETAKEIYRYQAFREIDKANIAFNALQKQVFSDFFNENHSKTTLDSRVIVDSYEEALIEELTKGANGIQFSVTGIDEVFEDGTYDSLQTFEEKNEFKAALEEAALDKIQLYQKLENNLFQLSSSIESYYNTNLLDATEKNVINWWEVLLFGILLFAIMLGIYVLILRVTKSRIKKIDASLSQISEGDIPEKLGGDFGMFNDTARLTTSLIDYMHDVSNFAEKLGEGEFQSAFEKKSDKDLIGNSLIQMRDKLTEVAEEDKVRNWMNEGQTKFNDIIRQNSDDFEKLTDSLVDNMVKHIKGSQGTLYIVNDNDESHKFLELKSAYAYDRKKFVEKKIEIGEGLAGQVFLEGKTLHLDKINEEHFDIKSGLGISKPSNVIIVPLKDEDSIEGIVEIATFKEFQQYEVEFIEKIGSTIASSLRSVKTNDNTKRLLAETRQREEEMKAQEEELRQNMEELAATQEQLERIRQEEGAKAEKTQSKFEMMMEVLNHMPAQVYVKDNNAKYILLNNSYAESHNSTVEDMIGKDDFDFFSESEAREHQKTDDKIITTGETFELLPHKWTDKNGLTRFIKVHKASVDLHSNGERGIIGVIFDVSDQENTKQREEMLMGEIEKLKKQIKG